MDTERIANLLAPFLDDPLSQSQLKHISIYINLLLRWNARINLTAIRKEEEIVTRHFGESLFMARYLFPQREKKCHPERSRAESEATGAAESKDPSTSSNPMLPQGVLPRSSTSTVLDLGSGAGFPALPLKIWAPEIRLTLIESNHKKAAFLKEVIRALTLTDVNVIAERAENLTNLPKAEIVTLRAVECFETIVPQAISFMAPAGRLALLIGASQQAILPMITKLQWSPPIPIPESQSRILAIGHQV